MILTPTAKTLGKYGLTLGEWSLLLADQDGKCALCDKPPGTGRFVVDHLHVPGWKKMPPHVRRTYVRGLLCTHCNHRLVGQFMTLRAAEAVVRYLRQFEERRCRQPTLFDA